MVWFWIFFNPLTFVNFFPSLLAWEAHGTQTEAMTLPKKKRAWCKFRDHGWMTDVEIWLESWRRMNDVSMYFSQNVNHNWKGRFGLTWAIKSFGACVARGFDAWQAWNDYPSTTLFPPSDGSIMRKATLRFVSGNCHKWKGKVPKARGWRANIFLTRRKTRSLVQTEELLRCLVLGPLFEVSIEIMSTLPRMYNAPFLGGASKSCEATKKGQKTNQNKTT